MTWHQETLQHEILDEFREAQWLLLEPSRAARDKAALKQRRAQLSSYKLGRALDKFLRITAPHIAPLPFVPMSERRQRKAP